MEKVDVLNLEFEAIKAVVEGCIEGVNATYANNKLNKRVAIEFNVKPKVAFLSGSMSMMATLTILTGEVDETNSINREAMRELHEYAIEVDTKNREAVLTVQIMMMRRLLQEAVVSLVILATDASAKKPINAKD